MKATRDLFSGRPVRFGRSVVNDRLSDQERLRRYFAAQGVSDVRRPGELVIYYTHPGGWGWDSVTVMVAQLARLLDARVIASWATRDYTPWVKALAELPRRTSASDCLVIAPQPAQLNSLVTSLDFVGGYRRLAGWVIDSFWEERIPRIARRGRWFDHLFLTDAELLEPWEAATGVRASWLPFGTDALGKDPSGERTVDLQRLGRQPASWDDDDALARAAARYGLVHGGAQPRSDDPTENQEAVWSTMLRAKYAFAFNNLVNPTEWTHPVHQYLTGRWTDSLACGASVVGISPACRATTELLWDGALLELESTDVDAGLAAVRAAVDAWTPAQAAHNHRMALQRLDWRWRFQAIADYFDRWTPALNADLDRLRTAIGTDPEALAGPTFLREVRAP